MITALLQSIWGDNRYTGEFKDIEHVYRYCEKHDYFIIEIYED